MKAYFDTSYLLKCYVQEPGSTEVRHFASGLDEIACSEFGRLEFFGALHRCLRERRITRSQFDTIAEQFEIDETDRVWNWIPFHEEPMARVVHAFRSMAPEIYLRTGDAIHLVSARDVGLEAIYSNDARMLDAAEAFGLEGRNVIALAPG